MYLETWDVCWAKAGHAQFTQPTLPIPEFYKLQITCSHTPYHHHHYNHCKYLHLQVFVILVFTLWDSLFKCIELFNGHDNTMR